MLCCSKPVQLNTVQWFVELCHDPAMCSSHSKCRQRVSAAQAESACTAVVFATTSALEDEMAIATCRTDARTNEHESCAEAVAQTVAGNSSRKVQGKNAEEEDDGCCLCWCRPKEAGILHGSRYRLRTKHQVFA